MVGYSSLNKPGSYRVFHPPVTDHFYDARHVLAEAPSPPATIAVDASPPAASNRQEHYEELKAALRRTNWEEATRVANDKYHFSFDEKLAVSREVFGYFFARQEYTNAASLTQWNKPSMEEEYQRALEGWYRTKLLSSSDLDRLT